MCEWTNELMVRLALVHLSPGVRGGLCCLRGRDGLDGGRRLMTPIVEMLIWSGVLTALVCYAWWARIRVWALRQDLLAIRDEAASIMGNKGMLDDVHHLELREAIDAIIRSAPDLTLFTAETILVTHTSAVRESDAPVPPEIAAFSGQVGARLAHYLLFESITGWTVVSTASLIRMFATTSRPVPGQREHAFRFMRLMQV
jgi:hypothetical protein